MSKKWYLGIGVFLTLVVLGLYSANYRPQDVGFSINLHSGSDNIKTSTTYSTTANIKTGTPGFLYYSGYYTGTDSAQCVVSIEGYFTADSSFPITTMTIDTPTVYSICLRNLDTNKVGAFAKYKFTYTWTKINVADTLDFYDNISGY